MNQEQIMQQLQIGMQALQTGNLDTAENIFRIILSANPSEVHSLHFLGVVFCQKGNLDDGIALIEQSTRLDSSRFGPYLNMGRFLVGSNQWVRAVAALEQAIQRDASSFDAWSMLAQASFFVGNADAALKAGKKAAEINPGNAEIFFSLGVYASGTDKDEAIDHYRHAVSIDPASFKAWVNLGNCLLDSQRIDESISAFNEALKSDPSCFQALMGLCRAYENLGQWVESLAIAQQALSMDPSSHDAAFWVGFSLHKLGRIQDAVNAYRVALNISPVSANTHLYLASALEGLSEQKDALQHYELATKVDPKLSLAFTYWGALLQKCGDLKLAIDKCRRAVEADPLSADALVGLGTSLHENGEVEEAIISFRKAIDLNPDFAEAYLNLGIALKEEGEAEEAIASYRKAIELKPDFVEAYLNLGFELREEAEVEEVTAIYRKAIELNPDHADLYFELASSLIRQGRVLEALDVLRNGLRQCNSSPALKHLIGTLLISQGQEEEGELFLEEAFSIDSSFRQKDDGFSLRSDTAEGFWRSLHSTEEAHLGYWKQNPLRKKLASVICSLDGVNSVLECGCNVGGNLFAINAINAQIMLKGVDMNSYPIEFGKQKFIELGIDVDMSVMRLQDLENLESNSVDVAYTSAVLQHIPPEFIPDILANMIRISRKYVVFWELHGFSPADALVHRYFIDASPSLDGRWLHDYWNILERLGVERESITAQHLDPKICLGKVSDANCIFSFPVP